jgi:DNA-binding protein H-NS
LFDYFISDGNISNENKEFLKNFTFLNNYLETLRKDESEEYINKVREVAQKYNSWLEKKVHLFKRKNSSN